MVLDLSKFLSFDEQYSCMFIARCHANKHNVSLFYRSSGATITSENAARGAQKGPAKEGENDEGSEDEEEGSDDDESEDSESVSI